MAETRPAGLNNIIWQDLVSYRPYETLLEVTLPLPWLVLMGWSAFQGWYVITVFTAFYFFLTGLRVTHNAFHYALGLPRFATDCVMFALSILMLGAHHAIQVTHMRHHRYCMQADDVEGHIGQQNAWVALTQGYIFTFNIHRAGLQYATPSQKKWIQLELLANTIWLGFIVLSGITALQVYASLMILAYGFSAFFAVWTVHHDCPTERWNNSRSLRDPIKSWLCYQMFYHIEHHLFPKVPTCHLKYLAKRLDQAGFEVERKVF